MASSSIHPRKAARKAGKTLSKRDLAVEQAREVEPELHEPGFWGWFYASLWLQSILLAAVILAPEFSGLRTLAVFVAWVAVYGIGAIIVASDRPSIHDLLASFNDRERFALGLLMLGLFLAPLFFARQSILPHGFLWSAALALPLAVTPSNSRRLLALTLAGSWCAALWVRSPLELILLLAFAAAWLLALGMTHLAFVADAYGYTGRRAMARLIGSAGATALPAALAGAAAWAIWPGGGLEGWSHSGQTGRGGPQRILEHAPTVDLFKLLWQLAVLGLMIAAAFLLLYLLRRWWLNRQKPVDAELLPGQKSRMEYAVEAEEEPRPGLGGLRGRIVGLWGRWEAALAREGLGRRTGETAAEYAVRIASESPAATPDAGVTELLDRAHYSPHAIEERDVERMRALVGNELSRQSIRLQPPPETKVE